MGGAVLSLRPQRRAVSAALPNPALPNSPNNTVVSYAYNINFVYNEDEDQIPYGLSEADLTAPAQSVLLFEVANVRANVAGEREGAVPGGVEGVNFSASANGLDHRLYARKNWSTGAEHQYATGYLGGRPPFPGAATADPGAGTQFAAADGRHAGGSEFLFGDGHCRWMRGRQVSSGHVALSPNCNQDNIPALPGCVGGDPRFLRAAGTYGAEGGFRATFSVR